MMQTVGTCSICGGNVKKHTGPWHGVVPPGPARCEKCGALSAAEALPVIPMVPARQPERTSRGFRHVDRNDTCGGGVWRDFPNSNTGTL